MVYLTNIDDLFAHLYQVNGEPLNIHHVTAVWFTRSSTSPVFTHLPTKQLKTEEVGNLHWWVKLEVWSVWAAGETVDIKSLVTQEVVEVNQISQLYLFLMFDNNSSLLFQTLVIERIINIKV